MSRFWSPQVAPRVKSALLIGAFFAAVSAARGPGASGAQGADAASAARVTIAVLPTPPRIDAEATEWAGVEPLRLDRRAQLLATDHIDWSGPEDASVLVRLAYDEAHLYLHAHIVDDGPLAPVRGETWQSGDVLELFFDCDLRDAAAGEHAWNDDDLQLMLLPFSVHRPWASIGRPEKLGVRGSTSSIEDRGFTGIRLARKLEQGGTSLEAAIPLHNLPGFLPGTREIGFNLAYGDRDPGRGNYNYLVWVGSGAPAASTRNFGRLVFGGIAPLSTETRAEKNRFGSTALAFLATILPALAALLLLLVVKHAYRRSIAEHAGRRKLTWIAATLVAAMGLAVPALVAKLRVDELAARARRIADFVQDKLPALERGGLSAFEGPSRDAPLVDLLSGATVRRPVEYDFIDLQAVQPSSFGWSLRDFGASMRVWPYDIDVDAAGVRVGLADVRSNDRLRLLVSSARSANEAARLRIEEHDDSATPRAPRLWIDVGAERSQLECVRLSEVQADGRRSSRGPVWGADFALPVGLREFTIRADDDVRVVVEGCVARGADARDAWRPLFFETVSRLGAGVRSKLVGPWPIASRVRIDPGATWTCTLPEALVGVDRLWLLAAGLAGDEFRATKDGAVVGSFELTAEDGREQAFPLRHQVEVFSRRRDANSELLRLTQGDANERFARIAYEWETSAGGAQVTPGVAIRVPEWKALRSLRLVHKGPYPIELRTVVVGVPRGIDLPGIDSSVVVAADRSTAFRLAPALLASIEGASFHVFRDGRERATKGDVERRLPGALVEDLRRSGFATTAGFFGDGSFEAWVRPTGDGWGDAALGVAVRDPSLASVSSSMERIGFVICLLALPWLIVHILFTFVPRASLRVQLLGSVAFAAIVPLAIVSGFVNRLLEDNQAERQRESASADLDLALRRIDELGRELVHEASAQVERLRDLVSRNQEMDAVEVEKLISEQLAAARPKGFSESSFLACELADEDATGQVRRIVDRSESYLLGDTPLGPSVSVYLRWGKVFLGARADAAEGQPELRCAIGREVDASLLDAWVARGRLALFDLRGYPLGVGSAPPEHKDEADFAEQRSLPAARAELAACIEKLGEVVGPASFDLVAGARRQHVALHFLRDRAGTPVAVLGAFAIPERAQLPLFFADVGVPTFFWVVGSLLVVLVSFITLGVTGRISDPIDAMSSAAQALSAGDLDAQLRPVYGSDEIARLNEAFITMSLELRRRMEKQAHMNRAMARLSKLEIEAVVTEACSLFVEATGATAASVVVFDAQRRDEAWVASASFADGEARRSEAIIEVPPAVLRARGPTSFGDRAAPVLVLPLRLRDRHRALVVLALDPLTNEEVDLAYLQALVDQVAAALETARLYSLAIEDPSTGLPIPHWFQRRVAHEVERAQIEGGTVTLARLIVDAGTEADRHGVATSIARLLADVLAPPELATRLDAWTFELLLPGLGRGPAHDRLAEVQREVATFLQAQGVTEHAVRVCAATYPVDAVSAAFLERALEARQLGRAGAEPVAVVERGGGLFASQAMNVVLERLEKAAVSELSVLIEGETGTGKEVLADLCHALSARSKGPLVKVNCASIPESLLESALFGHERGAFTGAVDRHRGFFEQAHRGTLFLDEIGEMPLEVQAKLLRVLQDHSFHRVGGATTIEVDVRVVVATHRDLQALVHAGRFRQDLFFRLQGLRIHVPPLRERKEEIPYHVERLRARAGGTVPPLSVAALDALHAHSWPGNVRELENVVQRAFVLARGLRIEPEDLDLVSLDPPKDVAVRVPPVRDPVLPQPASREVGEARSQSERWHELCLYFQRDTSVRAEGLSPRRYCELFDVSRRTATRDLNNWLELGRLTCRGQKRALRYFLKAADHENDPL